MSDEKVSVAESRGSARRVTTRVGKGQGIILTRRGKPVARLEPTRDDEPGGSLSTEEIDRRLYGP